MTRRLLNLLTVRNWGVLSQEFSTERAPDAFRRYGMEESAAPLRTLRALRYAAEVVTFCVARATRPCFRERNHGLVAHAT